MITGYLTICSVGDTQIWKNYGGLEVYNIKQKQTLLIKVVFCEILYIITVYWTIPFPVYSIFSIQFAR